jgi:glucuronate isomerase
MKKFLTDDFLLQTETARLLYHEHAAKMPIYDNAKNYFPMEVD